MSTTLAELLGSERRPRIMVVGDVMLDRYVWGDVERISYEAPIPVFRATETEDRLGGAGSVATILKALDADVVLCTVVGEDPTGRRICELVSGMAAAGTCVLAETGRVTTLKERLLGRTQRRHPQQMVRIDHEQTLTLHPETELLLLDQITAQLDSVDAVLVSDYAKGVCTPGTIKRLIAEAKAKEVPVIVDPSRGADYAVYEGCSCVTPNRAEAGMAVGEEIADSLSGLAAARALLQLGFDAALVTLDRDGIALADRQGNERVYPVRVRQVYDITGAGDAVLAALGLAAALGADWPTAVELANLAGGIEVQRLGAAPITRRELLEEIAYGGFSTARKIVPLDKLQEELDRRRRLGQRIAMTNGCFDLIHPGHMHSLQAARSHGDCLVVGLNSDQSVRILKGPERPVVDERGRAEMLAALACVDYVVLFDETSVESLIEQVLPDVLVKAAQYTAEQVVGGDLVENHGGRIALTPLKGEYSTTGLLEKIRRAFEAEAAND